MELCPQLQILPCDFEKYRAVSAQVQAVLQRYDPDFDMVSLDEGYLDVTETVSERNNGGGGGITREELVEVIIGGVSFFTILNWKNVSTATSRGYI